MTGLLITAFGGVEYGIIAAVGVSVALVSLTATWGLAHAWCTRGATPLACSRALQSLAA